MCLLRFRRDLPLRRDGLLLLLFWLHLRRMGAAVRYIMPQRGSQLLAVVGEDLRIVCAARNGNVGHAIVEQVLGSQLGIGVDQRPVGGLLTFPGYWKMCRGTRAGVKAQRPQSGALQRGLDSGPASAMLCLSGECQLLPYPAEHISVKLTGKRPPVNSPSLCAPSIT